MASEDLDEIPPLEDIPNLDVAKIIESKSSKTVNKCEIIESDKASTAAAATSSISNVQKKEPEIFAGFKKGFLNSKPNKSSEKAKKDDMIYVKSNPNSNQVNNLRINDDIKDALKDSGIDASKPWLTDDFLEQIDKNDVLKRGFMNSRLIEKISKFQKNPQAALKECEHDIEAQEFLKEYLKIMGSHLSTNSFDVKTNANAVANQNEIISKAEDPEQKKANELVNNEEVRALLMDKDVQNLLYLLKNNPENSHRILRNANKDMQIKIQKLISYGLLGVQQQ